MVDDVLVNAFIMCAAKCPGSKLPIMAAKRVEDRVILLRELLSLRGDDPFHTFSRLARHHQGIGGDLAWVELPDQLHVACDHV